MDIGEVVVGVCSGLEERGEREALGCGSADSRWCHSVYLIRAIDGP